jgi:hypothetical protein
MYMAHLKNLTDFFLPGLEKVKGKVVPVPKHNSMKTVVVITLHTLNVGKQQVI